VTIQIFVDGACEPVNPGGIATYGFVIYRDDEKITKGSGVVGHHDTSNNVAEYSAAIECFKWLLNNKLHDELIVLKSDSELLINQLNKFYAVRARRVRPLYEELKRLIEEMERVTRDQRKLLKIKFEWIPREENEEADALSRWAYEEFCAKNPDRLQRYARYLASEKQKSFMKRLKIQIPPGLSKRMASRLIDARLEELKSRRE
jgi:ribonuclease HI